MTKAELKKLETLIGKLEALQQTTRHEIAKDLMGRAKSTLIRALTAGAYSK
jgi:hypothetical protein